MSDGEILTAPRGGSIPPLDPLDFESYNGNQEGIKEMGWVINQCSACGGVGYRFNVFQDCDVECSSCGGSGRTQTQSRFDRGCFAKDASKSPPKDDDDYDPNAW